MLRVAVVYMRTCNTKRGVRMCTHTHTHTCTHTHTHPHTLCVTFDDDGDDECLGHHTAGPVAQRVLPQHVQ